MEGQFYVRATQHDPRTNEGMTGEPVKEAHNYPYSCACKMAQDWSRDGYWVSVYDRNTGECVREHAPAGEADEAAILVAVQHERS